LVHRIGWKGKNAPLRRKTARFEFHLLQADLFSFGLAP
jgi:hypothetical protein